MENKNISEAFALLLAVFALSYVIVRYFEKVYVKKYQNLHKNGKEIKALIDSVSYSANARGGNFFTTVYYSFNNDIGKKFTGNSCFKNEKFPDSPNEIRQGDAISIFYLPHDPYINAPSEIVLRKITNPYL